MYLLSDLLIFAGKNRWKFFDVLQVFVFFSRPWHKQVGVYALLFCSFCWLLGIPFPGAPGAQIRELVMMVLLGFSKGPMQGTVSVAVLW